MTTLQEIESTTDSIDWGELNPPCDLDFQCGNSAKYVCSIEENHPCSKKKYLLCEEHSKKSARCFICGERGIPISRYPL